MHSSRFRGWVLLLLVAPTVGAPAQTRTVVTVETAPVWFEESHASAAISPDGHWAVFGGLTDALYDLRTGHKAGVPWPGLDGVGGYAFGLDGEIILRGRLNGQTGWFRRNANGPVRLPLPPDALPNWSRDGKRVAYIRRSAPDSGVFFGPIEHVRSVRVKGMLRGGLAWSPSGDAVFVAALDSSGLSTLYRVDAESGRVSIAARDLDGPPMLSPSAISPDGRHAFMSLAGAEKPNNVERNRPRADRWLSVYKVDLSNGTRELIAKADQGADLLAPGISGGRLFWTRSESHQDVVTMPVDGGAITLAVRNAAVASWRPDGRQLGFYFGDYRQSDWAINWDAGVVDIDASAKPTGPPATLIANYGEDFEPEWSPTGRWIAYHSHRSVAPIAFYQAQESDDIWLRRPNRPPHDTADIRLTNIGFEAGPPSWSRDGTRLVFASYDRKGTPGISLLWMITLDTATGRPARVAKVPLPAGVKSVSWAAWSPISDEIAIDAEGPGGSHSLWRMRSDGSGARNLIDFPQRTFGGVAWSRDGGTLFYSSLVDGSAQLFSIPSRGGSPRQLSHESGLLLHPPFRPTDVGLRQLGLRTRRR